MERGPTFSGSYFDWVLTKKRPVLSNEGLRPRYSEDGLFRFDPPRTFSASKAATSGDAMDGGPADPEKIIMKLRVNWRHALAQQLERISGDSDGGNMH